MHRPVSALVLPVLLALLLPSYAGLLSAPDEGALAYRVHGRLATGWHEGEVGFPGGDCRVEHGDALGSRAIVTGELPRPVVRVQDGRFRVAVPGPDCVPWHVEGDVLGRGRGASEGALVTWDAATGLLLSAERTGPRSVERVDLVPLGEGRARAAGGIAWGIGVGDREELARAWRGGLVPDLVTSRHWGLRHTDLGALAATAGDLSEASGRDVAVHWYYWASRATRACIEDGACDGRDLGVNDWHAKTRTLAKELADALPRGRTAYVVVETEFNVYTNADDRAWWRGPFSDHMIETARILRDASGGRVQAAYSLGAWDFDEYAWFDRVTAAYDVPGFQTHGSLSPDGPDCHDGNTYEGLFERKTLAAAEALAARTAKPLGLWDVFVASHHPSDPATGLAEQARYFRDLAEHRTRLEALNVAYVNVRYLDDWVDAVPGCLGTGEEHLGLYDPRTHTYKPAFHEYVAASGEPAPIPGGLTGDHPARASGGEATGDGAWRLPEGAFVRYVFRADETTNASLAVRLSGDGDAHILSTRHPAIHVDSPGEPHLVRSAPWPVRAGDYVTLVVEANAGEVLVHSVEVAPWPHAEREGDASTGRDLES